MNYIEYLRILDINESKLTQMRPFELLSSIILNHQIHIPFDTVRKFLDYNSTSNLKELYSDVDKYIKSVKEDGYGGTCFHLTWGLYNLLNALNYDVKIIRLEQQHFALVVTYNAEDYYVDVGFWAPLFNPLPLRENWLVTNHTHTVEWRYNSKEESGVLFCGGEPAKRWDGRFQSVDEFWLAWEESMNKDNIFLKNLYMNKWRDKDTFLFLVNNCYKEFYKGEKIKDVKIDFTGKELKNLLHSSFNIVNEEYIYQLIN